MKPELFSWNWKDGVYTPIPSEKVRIKHDDTYLEVMACDGGFEIRLGEPGLHRLIICPMVSNVVRVIAIPADDNGEPNTHVEGQCESGK